MVNAESVRRYETLTLQTWPALQTVKYDGWILRSASGYTRRANSIYPLGESTVPLAEKLAFVGDWYGQRNQPVIFKLTDGDHHRELDSQLAALGYAFSAKSCVQINNLAVPSSLPTETHNLSPQDSGSDAWALAYGAMSAMSPDRTGLLQQILSRLPETTCYYHLPGIAMGIACCVGETVTLFNILVSPDQRGKGYGKRLVGTLLAWGMQQGARQAFLQVMANNAPALRLYAGFGFQTNYHYWYRTAPSPTE